MYSDIKSILCSSLPKFPFTNFQIYEFWKKGFQLYRLSISMLYPKLSISKESSDKHLVGLAFFNRSFLFIYELGIGVYIHMKHSVLVQFIRWLCVQIRPKTDNEQLVCNFFPPMFSTTSCHSPVKFIYSEKATKIWWNIQTFFGLIK